jgi:hypothetical protein
LQVTDALTLSLARQQAEMEERLARLAGLRARYSNLATEVRHTSELLQKSQKDLADARANQAAAQSASLITLLDEPVAGYRPTGPGSGEIVTGALLGGLLLGLGLVFLRAPLAQLRGRRISDYMALGRRAGDLLRRRATDAAPRVPAEGSASPERRGGSDRRRNESPSTTTKPADPATPPAVAASSLADRRAQRG